MDLQLKVQEKFAELISEGYVDKIVKDSLQATVKRIVESSLQSYSDFGKQLEKHISEGMAVNLANLSLDKYNDIVLRVVQQEVEGTVLASAQARISERVRGILGTLEKKEWKLSEIVDKFREQRQTYGTSEGTIGLHVEESRTGGWHIYLDEDGTKDAGLYSTTRKTKPHYEFKYQIHLDKQGKPYTFSIKGESLDYTRDTTHGFETLFFQLYANAVTIEVDEDDCVLEYDENED